jgi:cobalamin biosynthesis protein CobD/CbiB
MKIGGGLNSLFVFQNLDVSGLLLIFASLLDALFGSHRLLGRVPGPDRAIRGVIEGLNRRVTLYDRGWPMGIFLGVIVCSILLSLAFLVGQYGDQAPNSDYWIVGKSVVLALLVGQRTTIDTSLYLFKRLKRTMAEGVSSPDQKGQFAAARWSVERTVNRFVDGYLCNVLFFVLGGFAWLLAFRVLSVFAALGSPNGVKQTKTPFFFIPSLIYSLLTLFPAGLYIIMVTFIGIIIRPSRFFMGPLAFFSRPFFTSIPLRLWALSANAWVLGINLKTDPDGPQSLFNWLGPKGGRARVNPRDVILSILLQIVAWLLILGLLGVTMLRFSS